MSLRATIDLYRAAHGVAEYRFCKKQVVWSSGNREHVVPISAGEEISETEYQASLAEYEKVRRLAFLGKYPKNYWRYEKQMTKEGWREHLIRDIEMFDDTALAPAHRGNAA